MIDTCCLNCVYFSAYTNECSKNHLGDSVEIDNPKGAKCEDWEYSEFTSFASGYPDANKEGV